jgi:hypothetical protein
LRKTHTHLIADAREALKDLERLPLKGADLPGLFQLIEKLDYEFNGGFFHGHFWVPVARGMGMEIPTYNEEEGCGKGHILFFRMRGVYRRAGDFAIPSRRRRIADDQWEGRRVEARRFCLSLANQ